MQHKGLTIIEAIVVMAIMGLMVVGLGSLFIWQSSVYSLEAKKIDVERAHNNALEKISKDARAARAVTSSYGGYTSGSSTLVLQVPIEATTLSSTEFDYIIYKYLATAGLQRVVYAASSSNRGTRTDTVDAYVIATSGVQFSYDAVPPAASIVSVALTSTGTARSKNYVLTDQLELRLRN
jgi:Tfp pilus assembly protein PilW